MESLDDFNYSVDQFEDMRVLKYQLPGFESLSLQQKKYIYYLSQAALSGRDIMWDQNFRYNLQIRKTIEAILDSFSGDKTNAEYKAFLVYAKRVFFANGIHHHYSSDKLKPGFTESYFAGLIKGTEQNKLPLANGQTADQLISFLSPFIFDEKLFARKVEQKAGVDMVAESALNFYEGVTQKEVEGFYASKIIANDPRPVSIGLNSKVVKINGKITELGLLPNEDAAKASYDAYLRNGLLTQIVRIKPGKDIEQAHMRCRSAISHWVYEKGKTENVIEFVNHDGKTYVRINDYKKLRILFGELLKEIQRVKSEGDFEGGKRIIEDYGVKVDPKLHTEIFERYAKLNLAPYTGFVNPMLLPVYDEKGEITDVKAEYVNDYLGQMLYYGKNYSFLPAL